MQPAAAPTPDGKESAIEGKLSVLEASWDGEVVRGIDRFVLDLDAPAATRWSAVIQARKPCLAAAVDYLDRALRGHEWIGGAVQSLLSTSAKIGLVMWADELQAIAKLADIPLGKLVALQLVYEASAACTAVAVHITNTGGGVAGGVGGGGGRGGVRAVLGRTMDWDGEFLKPLTVEVDARRGGKTVWLGTTWAGFVGVLTGMRPGAFAVAVNFRRTQDGTPGANLVKLMQSAWPVSFLVRHVLEDKLVTDYDEAAAMLAGSALIAPCYFTVVGCGAWQGCVITRGRAAEDPDNPRLHMSKDRICLQTNIDPWFDGGDNIVWSRERRATVRHLLPPGKPLQSETELWLMLMTSPVWNQETVYATVMDPVLGRLHTRVEGQNLPSRVKPLPCPIADMATALVSIRSCLQVERIQTCGQCATRYDPAANRSGVCKHQGQWHARYLDCVSMGGALGGTCLVGLARSKQGASIGDCHWSCCWSPNPNPSQPCPASGPHNTNTSNTASTPSAGSTCPNIQK